MSQKFAIAIIGAVSAGKSTLLNALLADTHSDMKIKRTTMVPQVYVCDNNNTTDSKTIRELNRIKNEKILNKTNIVYSDIDEMIHHVDQLCSFVTLPNEMIYTIYDIPGLNDAKTKNLYFDYIKNNCHKFDIIIYVVDVNSAMNTSDDIDILKHVVKCINYNRKQNDIYTYMYILVNKCDDMTIANGELILLDEHKEMLEQVEKVVKECIKSSIDYEIMPVCLEDWYIFRMCSQGNGLALKDKYEIKLSRAIYGNRIAITPDTFKQSHLIDYKVVECLLYSNYYRFRNHLKDLISNKHAIFYMNSIKYDINNTPVRFASVDYLVKLDNYYNQLTKCSISPDIIVTALGDYCDKFIKMVEEYFDPPQKFVEFNKFNKQLSTITPDIINDIFNSTITIYYLYIKYKFTTKIRIIQLKLIDHFEEKIKKNISFSDFIECFEKLHMLLAAVNPDKFCDSLTDYFKYYFRNIINDIPSPTHEINTLDKYRELITKYQLKITLIDIILIILTRYYKSIEECKSALQIMNYWNNIKISHKNFDSTIGNLLYLKYYFNSDKITPYYSKIHKINIINQPVYDFYLEETLMRELENSKYSTLVTYY